MPSPDPERRRAIGRAASARYYAKNKAKVIALSAVNKRRIAARWQEFKKTQSCAQCGEDHVATLDFHHVIRSKSNKKVHIMAQQNSWEKITEELKKCIVLCANCHRKLHYEENELKKLARSAKRKKKVDNL